MYQSLINLSWVDKLLDNIRKLFVDLYGDQLKKPHTSQVDCPFDDYFDQQVRELEKDAAQDRSRAAVDSDRFNVPPMRNGGENDLLPIPGMRRSQQTTSQAEATLGNATPATSPDTSRPGTPTGAHLLSAKAGPKAASRRARKAANNSSVASADEGKRKSGVGKPFGKKGRKWDADGMADEEDDTPLDYSAPADKLNSVERQRNSDIDTIDTGAHGIRTKKGDFVLKDLDDEVHSILANADSKKPDTSRSDSGGIVNSSLGALSGMFRNIIGGKVLTKADLDKPMKAMEEHLLNKNVAREAAVRLCEGVERELIGVKTGSFESIQSTIRTSMESSLRKILTPTTSLDILRSITAITSPASGPLSPKPRPYVISIVGVNGVGKSTNLSKLAFFLLQNNFNLLIAACDTFRSGAVEQLRVHARNLKELSTRENLGKIELYEKGYGKDAANIARDAVSYAASQNFDVVLIDTAGRRHNDARLMSSLEKFAQFAQPDKILMVGEALVGSDSVAQARSFNEAFGKKRGLDGFIISKCDTVGDMVGSLVSMVHATGIPVVFLGVGQTYGDLRTLSVGWAVGLLMQ